MASTAAKRPTSSNVLQLFKEFKEARNIDDVRAAQLGLELTSGAEVSSLLGFRVPYSGVLVPYPHCNGAFARIRVLGAPAEYPKYLSPRGSTSIAYLPAELDWESVRADTSHPILITEGELKAAEAARSITGVGAPAALGIAGVSMGKDLLTAGIEWRGRAVYVCFDHDGDMAGYKPQVELALGQTCSLLQQHGALVSVINLRMTTLARADVKMGLDDYLLAGGSWSELWNCRSEPAEWCEMMAELMRDCIYVIGTSQTHIYNTRYGVQKSVKDFHDAHVDKVRYDADNKATFISRKWVMLPASRRPTAIGYTLDPRRDLGLLSTGKINLWEPFPTFAGGGDSEVSAVWEKFLQGVFGSVDCDGIEAWRWVAMWTAHMLNRPWESTSQAVMLSTAVQGIGKSLYGNIIRKLVGRTHGLEINADALWDTFQPENIGTCVFLQVNELDAKFSAREGQLNELITSDTIKFRQMFKDPIVLPNLRRWYFTSNSASPCRLSRGQRRILVLHPPQTHDSTRGEWDVWVRTNVVPIQWSEELLGAVSAWYSDLWEQHGSTWKPNVPVPRTEAADEAAEASMTTTQLLVQEMMDSAEENGGLICASPNAVKGHVKAFGELSLAVRARGGNVGSKLVKREGKVTKYRVYDLTGKHGYHTDKASGTKVFELDPVLVIGLGTRLEAICNGFETKF